MKTSFLFLCFLSVVNVSLCASKGFNAAPPATQQKDVEHSKDGNTTIAKGSNGVTHIFSWFPNGSGFTVRTARSYSAVVAASRNKQS